MLSANAISLPGSSIISLYYPTMMQTVDITDTAGQHPVSSHKSPFSLRHLSDYFLGCTEKMFRIHFPDLLWCSPGLNSRSDIYHNIHAYFGCIIRNLYTNHTQYYTVQMHSLRFLSFMSRVKRHKTCCSLINPNLRYC